MFIAMNRFEIVNGSEDKFEEIWRNRDSHLNKVKGFVEFNLLKGHVGDESTLYASHTKWESRECFENWTKSEEFSKAHQGAGGSKNLYIGHPKFEGFEKVQ